MSHLKFSELLMIRLIDANEGFLWRDLKPPRIGGMKVDYTLFKAARQLFTG